MPPRPTNTTKSPVEEWRSTLTAKEKELHDLAAVMLKKSLNTQEAPNDNGSYFADRCHAFKAWLKAQKS